MTIARVLAVAAVLTSSLLGLAGPARADQVMQGVYSYTQGDVHAQWIIYPSCVPTVGDLRDNLELPVACRLHVGPMPSSLVSGGDARLTGGQWEFTTNIKDGMPCPDGSTAPIQETYQFDDLTMTGTRSVSNTRACNGEVAPNLVKYPFTLAFQEPLPIPVDRYPLDCDPGGLKRCR
ncbi:hypothetical protein [Mycolicibacterium sp.]|uniref:hypothetical protein n=1 Tax=Mycolicibacterium sp. TaxID=2320850 RepID=UPI001A1E3AA5|nr:hypothetical protein [Mycolicibacterium sp.]MBJ7340671.1 hypothetical protein [Mycolicibacterium sp.]